MLSVLVCLNLKLLNQTNFVGSLIIFSSNARSLPQLWMSYSTIVNKTAIYYDVNVDEINFLPISVLLCSVLFSLFAMYVLDKRSLKIGLRLGSSLIVIGYLLRVTPKLCSFVDKRRYAFSLLGHCECVLDVLCCVA